MTNLPISDIVHVTVMSQPTWPEGAGFGTLLLITPDTFLPRGDCLRYYKNLGNVALDFDTRGEAYQASSIYFSQNPAPVQLGIARWFAQDESAELLSGAPCFDFNTWHAVKDGFLALSINGEAISLEKLDFSSCLDPDGLAQALSTRLEGKAVCQFDGHAFRLLTLAHGEKATLGWPEKGKIGTDVANLFAFYQDQGAILTQGCVAESLSFALNRLQNMSSKWYGFSLLGTHSETILIEASIWAEAQRAKVFGYTTNNPSVVQAISKHDIAAQLQERKHRRTIGIYEPENPYAIVSVLARAFAVDFTIPDATITLKFKQLPGVIPSQLGQREAETLREKNINYYTRFGESTMLAEGVMADGSFFDEIHGLDWFSNLVETNVFGLLYTSPKVPQTDKGMALIVHEVEKACTLAATAGLLSPGTWHGPAIGPIKPGDFLPKGFSIWAGSIAEQSQKDRDKRLAPPIKILAKGSGSIHFANIVINFER